MHCATPALTAQEAVEPDKLTAPRTMRRCQPSATAVRRPHARLRARCARQRRVCAATAACSRSTATRTASTRSGMEDGPPVVAKFYRPLRWTDAQILEEHAFVLELAEREIPVVAPLSVAGDKTLHAFGGFRFAVYPQHGGRAPELEDRDTLEWMGRFIGRIHAVGAVRPSSPARRSTSRASARSRANTCSRTVSFPPTCARPTRRRRAGARRRAAVLVARRRRARAAPARRLPCRQRAVDRRRPALRRLRRLPHGSGGAGPLDAAVRRARGHDAAARGLLAGYEGFPISTGASCIWSRRCARCA